MSFSTASTRGVAFGNPRCLNLRRLELTRNEGGRWKRKTEWKTSNALNEENSAIRSLPIFPLQSVVALPGCITPLFIFEARYRVLFNTLLAGSPDLEEELIQEDSPFKGTKEFGMCLVGSEGMANVGTILKIERHQRQESGQMVVISKGTQRFRVVKAVRMEPIVVCDIELLPDVEDSVSPEELQELSDEVSNLYRNVVSLNRKMNNTDLEEYTDPVELQDMDSRELSFWFASLFAESPYEQQSILEERNCHARLLREREILYDAMRYLSARCALKGAFQSED